MKEEINLPDIQNTEDTRGISIDKVGITNVYYPVLLKQKEGADIQASARVKLFVHLPREYKGVNMSRFMETLAKHGNLISSDTMPLILETLCNRLESKDAYARFEFDYYIPKKSPASDNIAPQKYRCAFAGELRDGKYKFMLEVNVIAASLCPCSKAMSMSDCSCSEVGKGAHNQRSHIRVRVECNPKDVIWFEDIIASIEEQASAPTYPILKRPDEKYVTELAYSNAKFSEDILRDVQIATLKFPISEWNIRVYNEESIHPFDVCCYQQSSGWTWD